MIPVFQDSFGFGNGNCAWACIASIFELSIEDVQDGGPPTDDDLVRWTRKHFPALAYQILDLGYDYDVVHGYPDCKGVGTGRWTYKVRETWEPPDASVTDGYWMATVPSQTLKRPIKDPYYPMPALHAVVMKGRECVHNPNPKNFLDPNPQVIMQSWWTHA
jgi:hypothetical protein